MKIKNVILLAFVLLLSASTFAQRPDRGPARRPFFQQLMSELNLTEAQEQQLQSLNEDFKAKIEALRESDAEREEKQTQLKALRDAHHTAVMAVLTEEQKAALETLREEAREQRKDRMAEVDREGWKKEVKTFRENTIQPVLKAQRVKLEEKLSTEDKAVIAELRAELKEYRQHKKQMQRGKGERSGQHSEGLSEAQRARHEQLKALVDKYEADIEALMEEIKPQIEQWKKEIRSIHEKYAPERPDRGERNGREFRGREGQDQSRKGEARGIIKKGHFLLLDPSSELTQKSDQEPANTIKAYPNPAQGLNTLKYEIRQPGKIRIELRDRSGRVLKVLLDDFQETGSYQMDIDVSELRNGVYYYTIIDAQGQRTEKLVVSQ